MSSVCYIVIGFIVFWMCVGTILSVLVFVPIFFYCIPYFCWLGIQQAKGRYTDKGGEIDGLRLSLKYATRLYKHWITGQELQF